MNTTSAGSLLRLGVVMLVAMLGLAAALGFDVRDFDHSHAYLTIATALLCFGLYMAGYGIDLMEARRLWPIVLIAITVGVVAKYAIIAGIAYAVTGDWRYAVVGMAVAQIDPLSVAALNNDTRMSPNTRTVLNMWASYDDPMTALAAPILMTFIAGAHRQQLAAGASLHDTLIDLAPFAIAIIGTGVAVLWRRTAIRTLPSTAMLREIEEELRQNEGEGPKTAVISGIMLLATLFRAAPLAALSSLFVRPSWLNGRLGDLFTKCALYSATFLLGIILSGGVDWTGGIVLGLATYLSQVLVAWLVVGLSMWLVPSMAKDGRRFSAREVCHLALAQQNGITAIVLALVLQPNIGIAVASISLAVVVVNLTHFSANEVFDRVVEPRLWPSLKVTTPQPEPIAD